MRDDDDMLVMHHYGCRTVRARTARKKERDFSPDTSHPIVRTDVWCSPRVVRP